MNILMVHNYYQLPGGEDTVVANEKKLLEKHGHKVILYTRHNKELTSMNKLQKLLLPVNTVFSMKSFNEVKALIKKHSIDIVHVHNTLSLISPSVYYAAFAMNVPVIQTVHNFRLMCPGATFYRDGHICEECIKKGLCQSIKHSCYRGSRIQTLASAAVLAIHRLLRTYKKINYICLTEFNKSKLLSIKQIDESKVYVKPNFTSTVDIKIPTKKKNQYVFVGRLEKIKGIDVLLRAWSHMGDKAPKLIIMGSGDLDEQAKKYVDRHKLSSVVFMGQTPNDEVRRIMAESKALILPSQWYEGFPVTIAEAYSLGLPVITGAMGNAGSLVKDGATGKLFKYNSAKALLCAVKDFERLNRKALGDTCINEYMSYYNEDKNYELLMDIYSEVIS